MNNPFFKLIDGLKTDIESIDAQNISKKDFDKKTLTIKQKILYLKNTQVDPQYKQICETSLMFIIKLFKEKMIEFRKIETNVKEQKRKLAERTIRSMSPEISDQNLESALKNPTEYTRLKILLNEPDNIIVNKLKYVEEKYQDVLELESNIAELHQMFVDFALIVDKQGDILDKVELGIKFTDEYITDGNEHMHGAIKEQKKYRRKQLCLCCTCTIIIITVGLIIFFVATKT